MSDMNCDISIEPLRSATSCSARSRTEAEDDGGCHDKFGWVSSVRGFFLLFFPDIHNSVSKRKKKTNKKKAKRKQKENEERKQKKK